jgi:predicted MFS family arabinose efflux permease
MMPHWVNLSEADRAAFRATSVFLHKRLEERATIRWALGLGPKELIKRLALSDLIDSPRGRNIKEPRCLFKVAQKSVSRPTLDAAGIVIAPWTRGEALRSWRFWSVALPFALALMAQAGFLVHEIAILEPSLGRAQAGAAVALTTAFAIVGRLTLGMVIDRFDQRIVTAASLTSQVVALAVMVASREPLPLFVAVALFGFSVGNLITFPALIVQREFEPASFGMLTALVSSVWQIGASSGPLLLGAIYDLAGSYTAPIIVCAALDLAAAVVILMRPRVQRRTIT